MSELTFANTDIYIRQAYSESLQSKLATLIANAKNGNEEMLKKQYDIILKAILDFEKKVLNKEFCKGIMSSTNFGYRKKKVKRSKHKGKKPTKALIRMCKRYRIKVTRKVGKKKVYKSITVLKRLLKRKKKNVKKKTTRRKTRRTVKRQLRFGETAFEDAHFIIIDLDRWKSIDYMIFSEVPNPDHNKTKNEIIDIFKNLDNDISGFIHKHYPTYAHGDLFCTIKK